MQIREQKTLDKILEEATVTDAKPGDKPKTEAKKKTTKTTKKKSTKKKKKADSA